MPKKIKTKPKIIAIASQKGGTGKTTTAVSLSHALAEEGKKILLVDLDPQSSLSISLRVDVVKLSKTIYNVLLETEPGLSLKSVILKTKNKKVDLVPANIDLSSAEIELMSEFNREGALRRILDEVQNNYDYIFIDCPPSLGLLTTNALTAAQGVIIPIMADYLAIRGASLLINTIKKVQRKLNSDLKIAGVLVTMYHSKTIHSNDALATIKAQFGDSVYKSIIMYSVKAKEAPISGHSIMTYAPQSGVANGYRSLAKEFLNHG